MSVGFAKPIDTTDHVSQHHGSLAAGRQLVQHRPDLLCYPSVPAYFIWNDMCHLEIQRTDNKRNKYGCIACVDVRFVHRTCWEPISLSRGADRISSLATFDLSSTLSLASAVFLRLNSHGWYTDLREPPTSSAVMIINTVLSSVRRMAALHFSCSSKVKKRSRSRTPIHQRQVLT